MTRRRSISQIMGSERIANWLSSRRFSSKRPKVRCHCDKCNGKLVLLQTKMLHEAENINDSNFNGSLVNASSSLINQDEDLIIIPLEENSTINPLEEVVSIISSLEENLT